MSTSPYFSYLLRIWQAPDLQNARWQASLEDPHTHQVLSFSSIEQLAAYLREKTREEKEVEGGREP